MKVSLLIILISYSYCYFFKSKYQSLNNNEQELQKENEFPNNEQNIPYQRFLIQDNFFLPNFTSDKDAKIDNNECLYKEGILKIRDIDSKDEEIPISYAILSKHHLTYYKKKNELSSIEGSIELSKIEKTIKIINGYPKCFQLTTLDNHLSSCSICAESESIAHDWVNTISQNIINCNQIEKIKNINKRGFLLN